MPFAPTDLNGLFLWLKGDALALADNDPVASWTDSGPLAKHATQATGANQPVYKSNVLNGKPGLLFDGVNDALATATIDNSNWEGCSIFAVVQPVTVPVGTGFQVVLESSTTINTTSNVGAVLIDVEGPDPTWRIGMQNGSGIAYEECWGARPQAATPAVIELHGDVGRSRANAAGVVNGDWLGEYVTDVKRTAGSRTMSILAWYVGARGGTSSWFSGYIFEIIAYRKVLGYDRLAQVRAYLTTKYGVTFAPTDAIWVLDGYSHTDADGVPPPNRRFWNRALQRITPNVEWRLAARLGNTAEKFADDATPGQRFLETSAVATKILTSDCPGNDFFYGTAAGYGGAVGQTHMVAELARIAESGATHRAVVTQSDNNAPGQDPAFYADASAYNTWIANPANRNGADLIDYSSLTPIALTNGGVNTNDATWFYSDKAHVTEFPGHLIMSRELWVPWLASKGLPSWSPASLAVAPMLWLDASAITGKVDGDPISQWDDVSGRSNHATQVVSTKQPLYKTNILGYPSPLSLTLPVVRFDGTDDFLVTPALNFSASTGMTIAMVLCSNAGTLLEFAWELTSNSSTTAGGAAIYRNSGAGGTATVQHRGTVGTTTRSTTALTTVHKLVVAALDLTLATASEVLPRYQGTAFATSTGSDNAGTYANAVSYIGGRGGLSNFLGGDIAELVVLPYKASLGDYRRLEAYLRDKWIRY